MADPQLALSSSSSSLSSSLSSSSSSSGACAVDAAGRLRRAISRTLSAGLRPAARLLSASRTSFTPQEPPLPLCAVPCCGRRAAAPTEESSESLESRFTPQAPPPPLRAVPRCGWQAAARSLAARSMAAVERAREVAARNLVAASKSSESLESRFTLQAPPPLRAAPLRTGESPESLELEQEVA